MFAFFLLRRLLLAWCSWLCWISFPQLLALFNLLLRGDTLTFPSDVWGAYRMLINIRRRRYWRFILPTFFLKSKSLRRRICDDLRMMRMHCCSFSNLLHKPCWLFRKSISFSDWSHFRPWFISFMRWNSSIRTSRPRRSILIEECGPSGHDLFYFLIIELLHHLQWVETADWSWADVLVILHDHFFLFKYLLQILVILIRSSDVETVFLELSGWSTALMVACSLRELWLTLNWYIAFA